MLHTKFSENPPAGYGEEDFWVVFIIYGLCGHPGHVTPISRSNFRSPYCVALPMEAPHKISLLIGQAVSEKTFEIVDVRCQTD